MQAFCDLCMEYGGYINAPDSAEKKTLKYEMFEDALQDPQEKNMVSILVEK